MPAAFARALYTSQSFPSLNLRTSIKASIAFSPLILPSACAQVARRLMSESSIALFFNASMTLVVLNLSRRIAQPLRQYGVAPFVIAPISAGTARSPRLSIHAHRGSVSEILNVNPDSLIQGSFGISQAVGVRKKRRTRIRGTAAIHPMKMSRYLLTWRLVIGRTGSDSIWI